MAAEILPDFPPFIKYMVHTLLLFVFVFIVFKLEKRQLRRLFKI